MPVDIATLRPKSLAGIKTLAKDIKRRDGIQHARALDVAAQQAGHADYRSARATLAGS